jgi:hypothetical protein
MLKMRVKSRPDHCSCRKIRLLPREERHRAIGPEAITVTKPSIMKLSLSNSSLIWALSYESGRARHGVFQKWNRRTVCCGMLLRMDFGLLRRVRHCTDARNSSASQVLGQSEWYRSLERCPFPRFRLNCEVSTQCPGALFHASDTNPLIPA